MSLTWIAQLIFTISYVIAYFNGELPHVTWITITVIGAALWALALVFDNRTVFIADRRPAA
jgi:hypothetical protein